MIKSKINIIIGAISVAVIGLIIIQFYWMNNAIKVQDRLFDENVRVVLDDVSKTLEKREFVSFIFNSDSIQVDDSHFKYLVGEGASTDRSKPRRARKRFGNWALSVDSIFSLPHIGRTPSYTKIKRKADSVSVQIEVLSDNYVVKEHRRYKNDKTNAYSYSYSTEHSQPNEKERKKNIPLNSPKKKSAKAFILYEKLVSDLQSPLRSIEERINKEDVDSLIVEKLAEKNIDTKFEAIIVRDLPKKLFQPDLNKSPSKADFRTRLFPSDPFFRYNYLDVNFPDKDSFVLNEVLGMLILSLLLITTLISCFGYTIFTLFKQKKLSDLKNDFINNMTHELKTPISTIALACEGLVKPDVTEKPQKLNKYANVISEENKRLSDQVTKILQMAVLDKSEFHFEKMDLFKLMDEAKESFAIRLEEREGSLLINYTSIHQYIEADITHFKNMINNLIDNAIKYCSNSPNIIIEVSDLKESVVEIKVKDNGIGLTSEEQSMVFEKFYRVSTGDRHDVKGFGLGLSYVKVIAHAHGGEIDLESKKGVGTTFMITVPTTQNRV